MQPKYLICYWRTPDNPAATYFCDNSGDMYYEAPPHADPVFRKQKTYLWAHLTYSLSRIRTTIYVSRMIDMLW